MCSYVDKYGLMLSVKMNSSFSLKSGLKSVRRNEEHLRSRQALMHNVSLQNVSKVFLKNNKIEP